MVDAVANVAPARSSMIWAYMCLALRNTESRGRSVVPNILLRMRALRFILATSFGFVELMMIPTCVFVEARRSLMCFPA
jgi:hypothetical protein